MELFTAHHQWAQRPDDERFSSLKQLHAACKGYAETSKEATVPWNTLAAVPAMKEENIAVVGSTNKRATVSHWAFGQLAARAAAPASYLRTLPTTLACTLINHGLQGREDGDREAQLLLHTNGGLVLRALTTEVYERFWNWEIAERLMELAERFNLKPAVPTFRSFGKEQPALYASDHDMYVFLMDKDRNIGGSAAGLFRGLIVTNSEVGAGAISMMRFLFCDLCGNHIIWGAKEVTEMRIVHKGSVRERFGKFSVNVREYLNSSTSDEEAMVSGSRRFVIASTKEDVLEKLFSNRRIGLGKKVLEASYDAVKPEEDGSPNTAWGIVQGLTRHSQTVPYADERTRLDKAGRNILQMAF